MSEPTDIVARAVEVLKRREEIAAERLEEKQARYKRILNRRNAPKPRDAEKLAILAERLGISAEQMAADAEQIDAQ